MEPQLRTGTCGTARHDGHRCWRRSLFPTTRAARSQPHHRRCDVQPLACSARGAGDPSLHRHGLWLQRVLAAALEDSRARHVREHDPRAGAGHHDLRLAHFRSRLDVHAVLRVPRTWPRRCGAAGWNASGPRKAGVVAAFCWCGGLVISALRHHRTSALDHVAWLRRDRRHRPGAWLHLAGFDADQMVSGPARHGDRHGDHGIWRRRDDRRAARQSADPVFQRTGRSVGRLADLPRPRRDLFRVHDGRRLWLSAAAGRLAALRLGTEARRRR